MFRWGRDDMGIVRSAVLILHGIGGAGAQFLAPSFVDKLFGPGKLLDVSTHYAPHSRRSRRPFSQSNTADDVINSPILGLMEKRRPAATVPTRRPPSGPTDRRVPRGALKRSFSPRKVERTP